MANITVARISAADDADTVDATSFTGPSWTPVVNRLYLLVVGSSVSSGSTGTPTITTTTGLSFVNVNSIGTNGTRGLLLYRALKPSGLGAGTIKADYGSTQQSGCIMTVYEFQGMDTTGSDGSGAVVQSQTGTGSSGTSSALTSALSAIGAGNTVFSCLLTGAGSSTPPAGFTEYGDLSISTPSWSEEAAAQDQSSATNPSHTWTGSNLYRQVACEVKWAGAGNAPGGELAMMGVGG